MFCMNQLIGNTVQGVFLRLCPELLKAFRCYHQEHSLIKIIHGFLCTVGNTVYVSCFYFCKPFKINTITVTICSLKTAKLKLKLKFRSTFHCLFLMQSKMKKRGLHELCSGQGQVDGCIEHSEESSCCIKCTEFVD
jgi:hypothetical protein